MESTNINYGEGGAASCVLVPPFNCQGRNYDNNYVSKLASISNSGIKETIERELILSKIIKENKSKSKKWINDKFILIDDYCILNNDENSIGELKSRGCKINYNEKYIVLYSKNGSCKPLTIGDIVSIEQTRINGIYDVRPFKYLGKHKQNGKYMLQTIDSSNYVFTSDKITRFCGDLSNYYTIFNLFSNKSTRKKNIKGIINSLQFFINSGIIHCDLKIKNFVSNEKGQIKIIDFGGAFSIKNEKYFNFSNICNQIKSNNNKKINLRTQHNNNFINDILDFISIHTEYYTPPEILILKLLLQKYSNVEILEYLIKIYNIDQNIEIINKLKNIIAYVVSNKRKMFYNIQCNKNNINTFIYKFDIFSVGIMFREICKVLYKYFDINVEESLIDLIEKMTDMNFMKRLNIDQIYQHSYLNLNNI